MIDLTKTSTIYIGRHGEHHYRQIEFDVSSLLKDEHPSSALHAFFKRPDGITYPVVTNYNDGTLTWSPSATDTANVGVGRLEIRVVNGEVIGKSVNIITIVEPALDDGGSAPPDPPAQEWVNQVLMALSEIDVDGQLSKLEAILSRIGNSTDYWSAYKTVLGYANNSYQHTHSQARCYPTLTDGIQLSTGNTSWALGDYTEIIPTGVIPNAYDIHWINFETASSSGIYEIHLFAGDPGQETLLAQVRTTRDNNQYGISSVPIQMPIQPPNARLSARIASSSANRNITLSVYYHMYGEGQ